MKLPLDAIIAQVAAFLGGQAGSTRYPLRLI